MTDLGDTPDAHWTPQGVSHMDTIIQTKLMMIAIREVIKKYQTEKATRLRSFRRRLARRFQKVLSWKPSVKRSRAVRKVMVALNAHSKLVNKIRQYNTKAQWLGQGEGSTKHFWAQAKDRTRTTVPGLRKNPDDPAGKVHRSSEKILGIVETYYKGLYSTKETTKGCREYLCKRMPTADFGDLEGYEKPLYKDIRGVVNSWKNGKSPGMAGIPYEFFKEFLEMKLQGEFKLIDGLCCFSSVFMMGQGLGKMSSNFNQGIIIVLYKKGDPASIKNYRPLTMLDPLYKLCSGLLAKAIEEPISRLIGKSQFAFIPGRQITDPIKNLQCMIDRSEQTGETVYHVLLD